MISGPFIRRPRLAMVLSIVITVAGLLAIAVIPVAQFPEITPPVVQVEAVFPGADAETVADTVGAPIEAQVNGVDGMLYMSSSSSNNGVYSLQVTFAVGTNPDIAQVNVQNRVSLALPRLPEEVSDQGVSVRKQSTSFLQAVTFFSPDGSHDEIFLYNYAAINVRDAVARLDGVGLAQILGSLDYSMRVWMNPDRMAALGITAQDVIEAIESQNLQASAGQVGAPPTDLDQQLQFTVRAKGRLTDTAEFEEIIVRANRDGAVVRVRDIARVELGAQSYDANAELNGRPAVTMLVYQQPGANALAVAEAVEAEIARLAERFPEGVEHRVIYDTTEFVDQTIREILVTLGLTFVIVVTVTFVFLQSWRTTLIPSLAIPVSLIGVFAVLLALGFTANTISLFALVLAIGLVVDDAIVVVENVERTMAEDGLGPREAAVRAMGQVSGPIVATTLVLLAVFVPVGFLPGITGQLYQEFAVTLSVAVVISSLVALTLSPALCAALLKPSRRHRRGPLGLFNRGLEAAGRGYQAVVRRLVRRAVLAVLVAVGVFGAVYLLYDRLPTSFLPAEDQGYFFVDVQLPSAASLARTERVLDEMEAVLADTDGIENYITVAGFSLLNGTTLPRAGLVVVVLEPWAERAGRSVFTILGETRQRFAAIPGANIFPFAPPSIRGLGQTGGFDFRLQALGGQPPSETARVLRNLIIRANQDPAIAAAFSTYSADVPQIFVDLDREKARYVGVEVSDVFRTLQAQLGAAFVNDFNLYDRVFQVRVQADDDYRDAEPDIERLHVRNADGAMVPLRTLVELERVLGPELVTRYNQFSSATVNGEAAPGVSSGQAREAMTRLAADNLPDGYGFEWSSLSFQEERVGNQAVFLFALSLLFAYLFLVGQYESWAIPAAVLLSVGVAVLGAVVALFLTGIGANIYTQIGLVLLIGLASKNAILIVEFAKTRRAAGETVHEAALTAARQRFRAVLMTAFSFICGVLPLVLATGAGSASRQAIGWTVFAGMLAATLIGILLVPALFAAFQRLRERLKGTRGWSDEPADRPAAAQ